MEVVVSTLAFKKETIDDIILFAQKNNIILEFSSGLPYNPLNEDKFLKAPVKRYAHNYFPPPKDGFVLNLASENEKIRNLSINHCVNGVVISNKVGAPFFSAHAGFCFDPRPNELGNPLILPEQIEKVKNWSLFIDSIKKILDATHNLKTGFLIENNVLAKFNYHSEYGSSLFCVESKEMIQLISEIDDGRFGILLDTAHLKVSCNTLGLDPDTEVKKIKNIIRCIHHSDNDSLRDTNSILTKEYWFVKHLNDFTNLVHVLEVRTNSNNEIIEQIQLFKSITNN